ncbi:hypothetical protein E0Z10_g4387 [Xylaria hypoxylon]|uniref:Heterokaryon incompatibility domain-containing protein n=1 Tax=Xylaria hypoxylon TaxID=37992 RepID=A0A4Z0YL55_9PEZI|nr:hypothetical protein E0Z10_g4387 [Xylaria hypoxylon]
MSKSVLSDISATFHDTFADTKPQNDDHLVAPGLRDRLQNETITEVFEYSLVPLPASGLRWTRLIRLLPGPRHDDICCEMNAVNLSECVGKYEALSYVWNPRGCSAEQTPIQVNGKTLYVGANLRSALFHLRLNVDQPRTLWVDALCINQLNIPEQTQQVAFMGDIYRSAWRTVIWMGESIKQTPIAFQALVELATEAVTRHEELSARLDEDDFMSVLSSYIRKPIPSPLFAKYERDGSIVHMGAYDWWNRAWTSQELLLSRQALLMKGTYSLPWETFLSGVNYGIAIGIWSPITLGIIINPVLTPYMSLWTMRRKRERLLEQSHQSEAEQLLENLVACRFRGATDVRDKVYGILALVVSTGRENEESSLGIIPNYVTPFREVYCHTARRLIICSKSLDVLGSCSTREDAGDGLPSWVPDWSFTRVISLPLPLTRDAFNQPRGMHASRNFDAEPMFEDGGKTLVLHGHELTTITAQAPVLRRIYQLYPHGTTLGDRFERLGLKVKLVYYFYEFVMSIVPQLTTWAEWEAFARESPPRNPGGAASGDGDPLAVYWQTLSTGTLLPPGTHNTSDNGDMGKDRERQERATVDAFYSWRYSLKAARKMHRMGVDRVTRPLTFVGYVWATWKKFSDFARLLENAYNRRLARLGNGYLALVPREAEVGDRIVLVRGGAVPLVLRAAKDAATGKSMLLGEAYVHGVMDGEAYDESQEVAIRIS